MQISHSNAMLMMVCHERTSDHTGMRCCTRDEGRSLETGLQEQVSNHRKLRWSRARVVSVTEKGRIRFCQVWFKETSESEPPMTCRKRRDDVKTGGGSLTRDKSGGNLLTAQAASGMKVA